MPMPKAKVKSQKQVGYLLSSGSPLSGTQKGTLKSELHSGSVQVAASGAPVAHKSAKAKKEGK